MPPSARDDTVTETAARRMRALLLDQAARAQRVAETTDSTALSLACEALARTSLLAWRLLETGKEETQ